MKNFLQCLILESREHGFSEVDYGKYYTDYHCMVVGISELMLSAIMICSFWGSWKKYTNITRCNPCVAWDQTYCLLSKYLVIMIMLGTPFCVVTALSHAILNLRAYDTHQVEGFETCNYNMYRYDYSLVIWKNAMKLLITICDFIDFVQSYEWTIMIFLIRAQHKKGIGTIYHNHMVSHCSTVRRTEFALKNIFYLFLLLIVVNMVMTYSVDNIHFDKGIIIKNHTGDIVMQIYELFVFSYLYYLMSHRHHYEFQRNKKTMLMQISIATIYHFMVALFVFQDEMDPI